MTSPHPAPDPAPNATAAALAERLYAAALAGARAAEARSAGPVAWDTLDDAHGLLLWTDEERQALDRLWATSHTAAIALLRRVQDALEAGAHYYAPDA